MGVERGGPEMLEQHRPRPGDPPEPNPQRGQGPARHLARRQGDQELKADATMELGRSSVPLGTSKVV